MSLTLSLMSVERNHKTNSSKLINRELKLLLRFMWDLAGYIVAPRHPPALFLDGEKHTPQCTNVRMQWWCFV